MPPVFCLFWRQQTLKLTQPTPEDGRPDGKAGKPDTHGKNRRRTGPARRSPCQYLYGRPHGAGRLWQSGYRRWSRLRDSGIARGQECRRRPLQRHQRPQCGGELERSGTLHRPRQSA